MNQGRFKPASTMLYALTIFSSAFLLFLVQPILAKQVLPWFGGSAAVWTTCMAFFQSVLVLGYAYADFTTRKLSPRLQLWIHAALITASLVALPIVVDAGWKPSAAGDPSFRILALLAATIGLPYFLLSSTGPLVQAWFARGRRAGSVYRLFSLSNVGSLLGLIAYPFAVEPWVTTRVQALGWSAGYGVFAVVCVAAGIHSLRTPGEAPAQATESKSAADAPANRGHRLTWLVLSFMGSFMLLAVTNELAQDVASVPFLWLFPLIIYLVTFILCFDGRYKRQYFRAPLLLFVCGLAIYLSFGSVVDVRNALLPFGLGLFVICMFLHGELAAIKPSPQHLTSFYLLVSLGGALGALAVGVVAPKIFDAYFELSIGLLVVLMIAAWMTWHDSRALAATMLIGVVVTGFYSYRFVNAWLSETQLMTRNFYGALRIVDHSPNLPSKRAATWRLMHGVILHGEEFQRTEDRHRATTYYTETSGIGRALSFYQQRGATRVGVVGLGTGTLAAYGRKGDVTQFYEINPQVVDIAQKHFHFIADSHSKVSIVLGDARLTMEHEQPRGYDVLAIDAFSSDAIPVHLLTREAMGIYLRHIQHDGVIAFHVSNRIFRLAAVVQAVAHAHGLRAILIDDDPSGPSATSSEWVLVARNGGLLGDSRIREHSRAISAISGLGVWTDDFSNVLQILR